MLHQRLQLLQHLLSQLPQLLQPLPHAAERALPLPLPLPFVVEGGVDSSWPSTELAGVELLGHPALELNGTLDEHGLAVSGLPTGCLPAGIAHVAVLKLRYDA